jgi:hypothetical protein
MKNQALIPLLLALTATAVQAQIPPMISYQGRITTGGTNFNGAGQFKFALVNNNGTTTFWSNNQSSSGGSQPTAHVNLNVANGLYSVLLGDATIPGMIAIPSHVFTNNDVRLRIWFNDGASGFEMLAPDQRISSVGYAMMGGSVVDGAITTSKLAPGAVTTAAIADGAITSAKLGSNSVTSVQLGDTINLGATNVSGLLNIYRTAANTPSIQLSGSSSRITTYGSDGLEQVRISGTSWGELSLNNSLANNATAVRLTAGGNTGGSLTLANTNGSARALLEGENSGGQLTLYQADGAVGAVLYGNDAGAGALSLRNTNGSSRVRIYGQSANASGNLQLLNRNGGIGLDMYGDYGGGGAWSMRNSLGNATMYADGDFSDHGVFSVRNSAGNETVYLWGRDSANTSSGQIGLKTSTGVETLTLQASEIAGDGAQMVLRRNDGSVAITLDANQGGTSRIVTQVLQITGGSDLSEQFNVCGGGAAIEPGMVVCINPEKPGELLLSTRAYDRTGAGGVNTGMLMGQAGTKADGKHPVALTGRVYCMVDASNGPVRPGDLLTTSTIPGHAMRAADPLLSQGAILGKAMTSLNEGRGLVLVLVTLQ